VGEPADSELGRTEAVRLGDLRLSVVEDRAEAELDLGRNAELVGGLQKEGPDTP
jgi:hypothetical protein